MTHREEEEARAKAAVLRAQEAIAGTGKALIEAIMRDDVDAARRHYEYEQNHLKPQFKDAWDKWLKTQNDA